MKEKEKRVEVKVKYKHINGLDIVYKQINQILYPQLVNFIEF